MTKQTTIVVIGSLRVNESRNEKRCFRDIYEEYRVRSACDFIADQGLCSVRRLGLPYPIRTMKVPDQTVLYAQSDLDLHCPHMQ